MPEIQGINPSCADLTISVATMPPQTRTRLVLGAGFFLLFANMLYAADVSSLERRIRAEFPSIAIESSAHFEAVDAIVGGKRIPALRARFESPALPGRWPVKEAPEQLAIRDAGNTFRVAYPSTYSDPIVAELGEQRVVLRPVGAYQANAQTQNGKIVYEGTYDSVDTIEIASRARSEELLFLRDKRAPLVYDYEIVEMQGVATVMIDGGAVRFLAKLTDVPRVSNVAAGRFVRPTPSLEIERPWVVDASGRRSESHARWEFVGDGTLPKTLRLDINQGSRNDALSYPLIVDPSFSVTGSMATQRINHTATLLPNGNVLITGGYDGVSSIPSAELYDPANGKFSAATGPMTTSRSAHTATLLASGKVLIAGGYGVGNVALSSAELYDPASCTFSAMASMATKRYNHTATLLPNGKVLIAGGYDGLDSVSSAELYDPANGTFSAVPVPLTTARSQQTATLLASGKVLIAGGYGVGNVALSSAELYDPASGTFGATGPLATARYFHTATLLAGGKVLIVGGNHTSDSPLWTAELYDPTSGMFSPTGSLIAGSLPSGPAPHTATLLPSGKVLVAGGDFDLSVELYDPISGTFSATSPLATARLFHTATLLAGGKVLIVGGAHDETPLSTAELYDPASSSFDTTGSMAVGRAAHETTMLPNGKVLIVGGADSQNAPLSTAELYDPASGTFRATGSPTTARCCHTSTLLLSGKVLIVGGVDSQNAPLSTAELYDPASGAFSPTESLVTARYQHTATLLPSGKVLIVGGALIAGMVATSPLSTAELYDPASGTFSATTVHLAKPRYRHTATLLPSGKVLIVGGADSSVSPLSTAEIYDPTTGTFSMTTGHLAYPRYLHTATLLPNGKVLIAGGFGVVYGPLSSVELYDPDGSTFDTIGSMTVGRGAHTATLLPSGKVLITGGMGDNGALSSAELYDPASSAFNPTESLVAARYQHTATLLATGKVLLAGGWNSSAVVVSSAELFLPDTDTPTFQPTVMSVSSAMTFGTPFKITGSLFRGNSEGSSGSTSSSATNYPLISLLSIEGGQFNWLVPDSRCSVPATCNFWDDPMTLTVSNLPATINPGWKLITVTTDGVPSVSRLVQMTCGPPVITAQPSSVITMLGAIATFNVAAQGGLSYQWRLDGVDIPGATSSSYTTPSINASYSGASFDVVVGGSCGSATSTPAVLTVADSKPPTAALIYPAGGEYWFLSTVGTPPDTQTVTWSMSDNVEVCQVNVSLLYSNDGGVTYAPVSGGGLPATFGPGGACRYPGVLTNNVVYTVPTSYPSGQSGSLYKIQLMVTDQAGNTTTVSSDPFFFVQTDPQIKTLILSNVSRMIAKEGISATDASLLNSKLHDLANHPLVEGHVVDLGAVVTLTNLYAAWDANPSNPDAANAVLFGTGSIHDYLTTNLLAAYPAVKYVVLVGDDPIIPMARIQDRTNTPTEMNYPAGPDITTATTVGQALSANKYLTDDPLAMRSSVTTTQLSDGTLFLPDFSLGRLVETPQEIVTTIATFIGQNGLLDLTLLDPVNGHKVLITGYDFLVNPAVQMRARWKNALGVSTLDNSLAPVNGSLIDGVGWGLGSVSARTTALRANLAGNGGTRYGIMGIAGHATHYEEGVPGTDAQDIEGLSTSDIYGGDACGDPSLGAIDLSGGVVYSLGCHGGLSVPGSCRNADHSLDLSQTMLLHGAVVYIANSGYGWGLKFGIGYGGRLAQIFTEEMTSAKTFAVGDMVSLTKQRYFLETPRYDPYDQKTMMQWMTYGLPMYTVKTGITSSASSQQPKRVGNAVKQPGSMSEEMLGAVHVKRQQMIPNHAIALSGTKSTRVRTLALPPFLTQLNLSFDFTAPGVYKKHNSSGDDPGPGCPDPNGCYYTLNGLVDRGTGSGDLPIEPYLIYDSRLSGTSQHGVLWKGGTYDEESNWNPVIAELVSNGADDSNHGPAPRVASIRPTSPRVVPGGDSPTCQVSDLEVNSLTLTAGEAAKNQTTDLTYSITRRYRNIDLEVFYYNNTTTPGSNCDRNGPSLGAQPYHQVNGSTISWAVPATSARGVWRVLVVYNTNTVDGRRGAWIPLDLIDDGSGTFRGNATVTGTSRVTYVVQAVDNRGNVTWLDYTNAQLPASGVPLGVPNPVDVMVSSTAVRRRPSKP